MTVWRSGVMKYETNPNNALLDGGFNPWKNINYSSRIVSSNFRVKNYKNNWNHQLDCWVEIPHSMISGRWSALWNYKIDQNCQCWGYKHLPFMIYRFIHFSIAGSHDFILCLRVFWSCQGGVFFWWVWCWNIRGSRFVVWFSYVQSSPDTTIPGTRNIHWNKPQQNSKLDDVSQIIPMEKTHGIPFHHTCICKKEMVGFKVPDYTRFISVTHPGWCFSRSFLGEITQPRDSQHCLKKNSPVSKWNGNGCFPPFDLPPQTRMQSWQCWKLNLWSPGPKNVHNRNLTWNLNRNLWKRRFLLETIIFQVLC